MITIIMPAHNEAAVIARGLATLISGAGQDEIKIIVVCNGCSDNTAAIARRYAPVVDVIETQVASKTHALNLGDAAAELFPRIYVDADVVVSLGTIQALVERLAAGDVHAVAPTPVIDLRQCSSIVRAYYAVRAKMPSARQGIGGSGVYGLSATGRARFATFPNITADDAFVRLHFTPFERTTLPSVHSLVYAPRTLWSLLNVRARIYFGISELARRYPDLPTHADARNNRALIGLMKQPTMWAPLVVYLMVNTLARGLASSRHRQTHAKWGQDQSSRRQPA